MAFESQSITSFPSIFCLGVTRVGALLGWVASVSAAVAVARGTVLAGVGLLLLLPIVVFRLLHLPIQVSLSFADTTSSALLALVIDGSKRATDCLPLPLEPFHQTLSQTVSQYSPLHL
jgi:hypothetical protein